MVEIFTTKDEFKKKNVLGLISEFILVAFAMNVGLSWNETIKATIDLLVPKTNEMLLFKVGSSVIVTLIALVVIRMFLKAEELNDARKNGKPVEQNVEAKKDEKAV